jgi:hypothetical protein
VLKIRLLRSYYPDVLEEHGMYAQTVLLFLYTVFYDYCPYDGCTPLHSVSDVAIARYLVERKADLSIRDNRGSNVYESAYHKNNSDIVAFLRSIGAPMFRGIVQDIPQPTIGLAAVFWV